MEVCFRQRGQHVRSFRSEKQELAVFLEQGGVQCVGERKWYKRVQGWIVRALLVSQESECLSECNCVAD